MPVYCKSHPNLSTTLSIYFICFVHKKAAYCSISVVWIRSAVLCFLESVPVQVWEDPLEYGIALSKILACGSSQALAFSPSLTDFASQCSLVLWLSFFVTHVPLHGKMLTADQSSLIYCATFRVRCHILEGETCCLNIVFYNVILLLVSEPVSSSFYILKYSHY